MYQCTMMLALGHETKRYSFQLDSSSMMQIDQFLVQNQKSLNCHSVLSFKDLTPIQEVYLNCFNDKI